ncbi:MAG: hypothetical protein JO166_01035 [Deltaproteobacteria bacterium]|nr:hypothetical protein [Deltaproteobacteria bacterium]
MAQESATTYHRVLPAQFHSLEPFSAWALAKASERMRQRLSVSMEELRAFYNAMLPQMETIVRFLNQFPLERLPGDAQQLLFLALSFVEVTSAVEAYGQPDVVNGFDPAYFLPIE